MLDKSIPYFELAMLRPAGLPVPPTPPRADGFFVRLCHNKWLIFDEK